MNSQTMKNEVCGDVEKQPEMHSRVKKHYRKSFKYYIFLRRQILQIHKETKAKFYDAI